MKQRITIDKLKELTLYQQNKLRDWWTPKYYDVFYYKGNDHVIDGDMFSDKDIASSKNEFQNSINVLPLLSIGQCIELLIYLSPYKDWECQFMLDDGVCDNLWDLVKSTL